MLSSSNLSQAAAGVRSALMRPPAVAAYLAISKSLAYKLIKSGELPSVRLSPGAVGVLREDLDAWLQQRRINNNNNA